MQRRQLYPFVFHPKRRGFNHWQRECRMAIAQAFSKRMPEPDADSENRLRDCFYRTHCAITHNPETRFLPRYALFPPLESWAEILAKANLIVRRAWNVKQ